MRYELITEKHRQWLKDRFGLTFEDIENMDEEESDAFCIQILEAECDALEADSDELDIIDEAEDIIYDERPEYDDEDDEYRDEDEDE